MSLNVLPETLIPRLFRLEYARMTAVLCRHFGLKHIETAEDLVSETFLKAAELWPQQGTPENPVAWLYTVAKNKAKDHLKHTNLFDRQIKPTLEAGPASMENGFDFSEQTIADSQLAMIFAVCNPANTPESQICLALQILCGFSVEEIADAFLTRRETIKKRLLRARGTLRKDGFQIQPLQETTIRKRLDIVLRTLYLLFNEGYFSRSNSRQIRTDLCSEAMRLCLLVVQSPLTQCREAEALLALMCYQSSRLGARTGEGGDPVLYDDQDNTLWDQELIGRGNQYLVSACSGEKVSKYHLEAGIAYWHTAPGQPGKWRHILHLYNQLILNEYAPMAALNRTFAFAQVHGTEAGLAEARKLNLAESSHYHSLLGYLLAGDQPNEAIPHYQRAIELSKSEAEKRTLYAAIDRIKEKQAT